MNRGLFFVFKLRSPAQPPWRSWQVRWLLLLLLLPAAGALSGCVSKAKARAQAHAAFVAGQQQAMVAMRQQPGSGLGQGPSVRIDGPVANPVVPWTPDLTLVKALIAANYQGASDPKEIIYVRNGLATRVQTQSLFNGHDVPLEAGDIIKLQFGPLPSQEEPGSGSGAGGGEGLKR